MDAKHLVVYVDVDDTLVRSFGSKRIPMSAVVEHVRQLHEQGFVLYCWSTGGADYAENAARELGIERCFTGFLPKPDILIDDQTPADWRGLVCVHPNEAVSKSAHDYAGMVAAGRGV
ncbi:DUF705 domain-containing protein [Sorangium sp. So ce136]|uniref:DUF705 domain-containing protein n=1 Tax=Sorangium sp. So ce136 TaxID=3133284 RepID=UPI003F111631